MARRQAGFTLTELLVAMLLLLTLLGVALPLLASATRHSREVEERTALQAEVRWAIEQLVRDLRQAYTGEDRPALESVGPSEIVFLSPDRAEPFHLRRVAYRALGGRLERAIAVSADTDGAPWDIPPLPAWTPVLDSIVDPVLFEYEDAAGVATTDAAAVRTVVVRVVVATGSDRPSLVYRTRVTVRSTV